MAGPGPLSRRGVLALFASAGAAALAGCASTANQQEIIDDATPAGSDYARIYGPRLNEPYPIPAVDLQKIDPKYLRQEVSNDTGEPAGTIVVDTADRFLYLTLDHGRAIRYGIGVGREGFAWSGRGYVGYKKQWPTWTPPAEMVARDPNAAPWADGMPPGPMNPLGARALYIFEHGKDTLYRLHGNPDVTSIGKAVSSGCIRLMQQDVIDLYARVPTGTKVVVL